MKESLEKVKANVRPYWLMVFACNSAVHIRIYAALNASHLAVVLPSIDLGHPSERAIGDELPVVDALQNALDRECSVLRDTLHNCMLLNWKKIGKFREQ